MYPEKFFDEGGPSMWGAGPGVDLTVIFGTLCVDRLSPGSKLLGGMEVLQIFQLCLYIFLPETQIAAFSVRR